MAQLGTVLSDYPEEVIVHVTSPRTGIQRRTKWPPSISEVIEACEEACRYFKVVEQGKAWKTMVPVAIAPPVRAEGQDYASMVAKHGRPIGRFETAPPTRLS